MVILDTNIIIDHLRQSDDQDSILMKVLRKENRKALFISVVSIQELYEGKSTSDMGKLQNMLSIIAPLSIVGYGIKVAELAGKIARDLKNPIGFADSAIAASCIFNNAELLTLNKKHFFGIPDLEIYEID